MKMHKHPDYPVKTKYDGTAHYLYRIKSEEIFRKPSKLKLPKWHNLKLKEKDYWRGLAQVWRGQAS